TVIDEPGYTPGYDTGKFDSGKKAEPAKPAPAKAEAKPAPTPAKAEAKPAPQPPKAEPAKPAPAMASADDPLGGMDPMAWLESLAARQGAKPEELITAANLDIPMPPADSVVDEPGYVDYDPFGSGSIPRASEPPKTRQPAPPKPAPAAEPTP